jgi:uncharacterized protein (TIGR02145 family)
MIKTGSFIDPRDGKTYKTVKIGSQTWMAENLNYNASGSECYGNNPASCEKYGRLYDWAAALEACPSGWHLPSDSEWGALVAAAGGPGTAGKKLKAKKGWNEGGNGTDRLGFSALPGGLGYSDNGFSSFSNAGSNGTWWSASEFDSNYAYYHDTYYYSNYWWSATDNLANNAYCHAMNHTSGGVRRDCVNKSCLFSVRCIKD